MSSLAIAMMCRDFPDSVSQRSGGLLSALLKNRLDYELIGMSPALALPTTDPKMIENYREFMEAA